jgi:uncharacterized protein (DUF433 family)
MDPLPSLENVPLTPDGGGGYRVGKSRVSLDIVIEAFLLGQDPEGIVRGYDTLRRGDVYHVLGYYVEHRNEVDAHLRERRRAAGKLRQEIEAVQGSQEGLKAKLWAAVCGENQRLKAQAHSLQHYLCESEKQVADLKGQLEQARAESWNIRELLTRHGCPITDGCLVAGVVGDWLKELMQEVSDQSTERDLLKDVRALQASVDRLEQAAAGGTLSYEQAHRAVRDWLDQRANKEYS